MGLLPYLTKSKRLQLGVLSLMMAPLAAEEAEDLFSLSLEELLLVEVTGVTLKSQPLLQAPAATNVFDDVAIARTGANTLSELIRFIPGLQLYRTDDADLDSLAIRGRNVGNSNREVLMLVNGMRVDNTFNNNSFLTIGRMNTQLIEKVEFIRGPASQLYGSNAFMGVINITTKQGINDIHLSKGSHKNYQLASNISWNNGSIQNQLNLALLDDTGESYTIEDRFAEGQVHYQDPMKQEELHYRLKWQPVTLNLTLNRKRSDGYLAGGAVWPDFNYREAEFASWNLAYDLHLMNKVDSEVSGGSRFFSEFRRLPLSSAGTFEAVSIPASDAPLLGVAKTYERSYWLKWSNQLFLDNSDFLLNLEWQQSNTDESILKHNYDLAQLVQGQFPITYYGNFEQGTSVIPETSRNQFAIVGQYIRSLTKETELTLGLRWDDYSDVDSELSSRFALVHTLTPSDSIKLIYGEAYRVPTPLELYVERNTLFIGDPNLKAEKVKTTELIWNSHRPDGGRYKASLFYNQFVDPILQIPERGLRYYRNAEDSESSGLELLTITPLSPAWMVRLSGSHLFKIAEGMPAVARTQANLALAYSEQAYSTTLDMDYISSRSFYNTDGELQAIGSQWVLNLSASYSLGEIGRLHFKANNLTDKETHAPPGSAAKEPTPNRGREIWFSYSKRF